MRADDLAILLPARRRFADARLSSEALRALSRADVLATAEAGYQAQLRRWFATDDSALPMAAALADAEDDALWLKLEPAYVRAESGVLRLLAFGDGLRLSDAEHTQLAATLSEVLAGDGWEWRSTADAWFLRHQSALPAPSFAMPEDLLGADILDHYPPPFWRSRFAEAQIALHHAPLNADREREGRLPVNALLFWGAGRHGTSLGAGMRELVSNDPLLTALSARAQPVSDSVARLIDHRHVRDFSVIFVADIAPALAQGQCVRLDFADGGILRLHRGQRWRFWRRAFRFDGPHNG